MTTIEQQETARRLIADAERDREDLWQTMRALVAHGQDASSVAARFSEAGLRIDELKAFVAQKVGQ